MYDILNQILTELVKLAIGLAFAYTTVYLSRKVKNNKYEVYLDLLEDVVAKTVLAFMQTFVLEMKQNGTFNDEMKETIKVKAIEKIKLLLPDEVSKFFKQVNVDIDTLIDTTLEKQVLLMKDTNEC